MTEQETVERIKEAVPGIVDLKRGCKIKHFRNTSDKRKKIPVETVIKVERDKGTFGSDKTLAIYTEESIQGFSYNCHDDGELFERSHHTALDFEGRIDGIEIIGRDITLNDIKKVFKQNNDFGSCNIVLTLWNLWNDEDDFTKQSDETKDFIGNLLT